jgi:hypothetical protein
MSSTQAVVRPSLDIESAFKRYQTLRDVGFALGKKLTERLTKQDIEEGAAKLGMLRGNTIVFPTEDMTSVLMDYCIYHVYRDGLNALDDYLLDCPPETESDEHVWLRAAQHSRYCLVKFGRVVPGAGAWIQILGTPETHFLADYGLSISAVPDMVMATRLIFFDNFCCTGGAGLLVGMAHSRRTKAIVKRANNLLKGERAPDPAPIICQLMHSDEVLSVAYV